jgi:hypothetical protein
MCHYQGREGTRSLCARLVAWGRGEPTASPRRSILLAMADEPPGDEGYRAGPTPPLLETAMRTGRNPMEYLLGRRLLGFHLWLVPLRLMPYRGAARMMIGTLMAYKPVDVCDLRVRTIEGEPYWVFASTREPRPEKSPFAKLGKAMEKQDKARAKAGNQGKRAGKKSKRG